jgi:Protein of unknown function (DUF3383)
MTTIPASAIVSVLPAVLNAGGSGLVLNGLMVTSTPALVNGVFTGPGYRVPIGTVPSFASAAAVGAFFGLSSSEYAKAQVYFAGYSGASQLPGSLLAAQWPKTDAPAWLQSGIVNGATLPLPTLQGLTGSLTVTMDGYSHVYPSIDLSGATSYSAAAALLAAGLNLSEPTEATVTTTIIAPVSGTFTGGIAGDLLTVTSVPGATLVSGAVLAGTGVTTGTQIVEQLSGTTGGVGTYAVSTYQNTASTTITATYGEMTVGGVSSGTVSVGQTVTGGSVLNGTVVTQLGTGEGLTGTYYVNLTQTQSSTTLTLLATAITVAYDSVSQAFFIASGIAGAASSVTFVTGSAAASLLLTQQTGAILSQGSDAQTPATFMAGVINITQNWASFFLLSDPDNGNGNVQKLEFAAWTNSTDNRYAFACWDTDITPTLSNSATTSLGYLINKIYNYSGTSLWYDPSNIGLAAFNCGIAACLDFGAHEGRTTFAFREQPGLVASVTSQQAAANLLANGYNFYGAYATANQQFVWNYNGSISGEFLWEDSYFNQIWLNNQFQLALMELLQNTNSIPYNTAGYTMIEQSLQTQIQAAINFGAIRVGVALSSSEALEVNTLAGFPIDQVITQQGWFLLIEPASPQVRAARATPVMYFFYTDGQSIQQITLNSVEIL